MKKIFKLFSPIATYVILYSTTFAQSTESGIGCRIAGNKNFKELVTSIISCFLTPMVTLLVSLAVVTFIYGVFKFVKSEGEDKQSGREFMFWGIVGLFVMVSLWGLVSILQSTFILR